VSSDNSWITAVVAVVVVVPSIVVLGCLLFAAFALWIWYRRSHKVPDQPLCTTQRFFIYY
jgi:hypothetical protein